MEERERAAAARQQVQQDAERQEQERISAVRRAGPSPQVMESPCTQATPAGPEFPERRMIRGDARQILILQPESSPRSQLERVAKAQAGACVFVEGETDMPYLMNLGTGRYPRFMDIATPVRVYRMLFEEGQFESLRTWAQVAFCNPDARVVVAGEFAGLAQRVNVLGQRHDELVVLLKPARVVGIQDFDRPDIRRQEEWLAMSREKIEAEKDACRSRRE